MYTEHDLRQLRRKEKIWKSNKDYIIEQSQHEQHQLASLCSEMISKKMLPYVKPDEREEFNLKFTSAKDWLKSEQTRVKKLNDKTAIDFLELDEKFRTLS